MRTRLWRQVAVVKWAIALGSDLAMRKQKMEGPMKVEQLMQKEVVSVSPEDSLREAYDTMRDNDFRHLFVLEAGTLVGVLSERDVLLRSAPAPGGTLDIPDLTVAQAMCTDVIACRPTSQLPDAVRVMIDRKIDTMPVTDGDGMLTGIITSTDILEYAWRSLGGADRQQRIPFDFHVRRYDAGAFGIPELGSK